MENKEKIECPDCGITLDRPENDGELTCRCGAVLISEEREYAELMLAEELSRKWYYSRDKQRYGPVPWNRIKDFVSRSKLGPDDLIWSRGMESWKKVLAFPELIEYIPEECRPEPVEEAQEALPASASAADIDIGPGAGIPVPAASETRADEGDGRMLSRPKTFLIQMSAGLLASLAFFQLLGIAVVIYALINGIISAPAATWLIAGLIVGAILAAGVSQLLRLLCAGLQRMLPPDKAGQGHPPEGLK